MLNVWVSALAVYYMIITVHLWFIVLGELWQTTAIVTLFNIWGTSTVYYIINTASQLYKYVHYLNVNKN